MPKKGLIRSRIRRALSTAFVHMLTGLFLNGDAAVAAPPTDATREATTAYEAAEYARARPLLLRAAANGSILASRYLGDMYRKGEGVTRDPSEAAYWYRKSAVGGDVEAQFRLASMLSTGVGVAEDAAEAFTWAKKASDRGHLGALELVADAYWFGKGTPVDDVAAVSLYRRLLTTESVLARERLGEAYRHGYGANIDLAEAIRFHEQAAAAKHIPSYIALGQIYEAETQDAPDWPRALQWYRHAAEARDPAGCMRLGQLHYEGEGVAKNLPAARRYFECAKKAGLKDEGAFWLGLVASSHPPAAPDYAEALRQFKECAAAGVSACIRNIGFLYYAGHGVKRDHKKARDYIGTAAAMLDPSAAYIFGRMHENGEGGLQDFEEAALWYWKAAELGSPEGQRALSQLYQDGRGVERDLIEAHKWLNLAVTGIDDSDKQETWARERDVLAAEMPSAELNEAQRRARIWQPMTTTELSKRLTESSAERDIADNKAPAPPPLGDPALIGAGSGFWVSPEGHLVTAKHVVEECVKVRVIDSGADRGVAVILAQDPNADVALLKADVRPARFATFRRTPSRQGEDVLVYGFPLGGTLASSGVSTTGTINALAGIGNDPSLVQISAPVQPGNSGGPMVDTSGHVLGVVVSKLDAVKIATAIGDIPQNVNFAVKSSLAMNLLDAAGVPYAISASDVRLNNADLSQQVRGIAVRLDCYK